MWAINRHCAARRSLAAVEVAVGRVGGTASTFVAVFKQIHCIHNAIVIILMGTEADKHLHSDGERFVH